MSIRLATKGCPGKGCTTDPERVIYWNHFCGEKSYLNRKAEVICNKCNCSYLILEAEFKCIDCQHYRSCNYIRLGRMLSALACIESARQNICDYSKNELQEDVF